ncbi:MAG: MarR family transcriptional regulator [Eubacterium sp.]|nr:MarR family transcriptional regulator [Eubacterium sp.]
MTDRQRQDTELLLENQLCFPLYACARKVVNLYHPYLKELGLTYTQYLVLLVLWQEKKMTVGALCRMLYLDNGTVTPLLKKLEAAGYLSRSRDPGDERVVIVEITEKGMEIKKEAGDIPRQVGSCLQLKAEEAEILYTLLYRILDDLSSR